MFESAGFHKISCIGKASFHLENYIPDSKHFIIPNFLPGKNQHHSSYGKKKKDNPVRSLLHMWICIVLISMNYVIFICYTYTVKQRIFIKWYNLTLQLSCEYRTYTHSVCIPLWEDKAKPLKMYVHTYLSVNILMSVYSFVIFI